MEAEAAIALDPALAGKLLGLANSVASGSRVEIVSIRDAVVRMGIGAALALVTATAVSARTRLALPQYRLAEASCGGTRSRPRSRRRCCRRTAPSRPPESFTAALLHDLGKLVISRFVSESLLTRLDQARDDGAHTPIEAELEVLGVEHAALGGRIAERWRLPAGIVKGIAYHHTPDEGDALVCDAVHVANVVAKQVDRGEPEGENDRELCAASLQRLGMAEGTLARCCLAVRERLELVLSAYH